MFEKKKRGEKRKNADPRDRSWLLNLPIGLGILLTVMVVLIVINILSTKGPQPPISPTLQLQTSVPIVRPTSYLDAMTYLSPEEAAGLRGKPGIVNFAVLKDGTAKYATTGLQFGNEWNESSPSEMQKASVHGTAVDFQLSRSIKVYHLNIYQPFTMSNWDSVYLFDKDGRIWGIAADKLVSVDVAKALGSINQTINANPDLSLSFTR